MSMLFQHKGLVKVVLLAFCAVLAAFMQRSKTHWTVGLRAYFSAHPLYEMHLRPSVAWEGPMVLDVSRERWHFNGNAVTREQFAGALRANFSRHPNRVVCIQAGGEVHFSAVAHAIDEVQGLFGYPVLARQCVMPPPRRYVAEFRYLPATAQETQIQEAAPGS